MTLTTRTDTMRAALFYEPGVVRYEEIPVPQAGPGEIVVKINTALTCGTDIKCYRRGHPVLLKTFPSPFGHEFAGIVHAVGEGVTRFEPGDRVVAANSAPCYNCFYCHKGKHNLCENLDLLNGAYAEYMKIPTQIVRHNTYRIPDHLSFEAAAFTEPLAVSLRGVELSNVTAGDRVAIIGTGPIGQLLVKLAKWKQAHVTVLGRNPRKLALAKTFGGADETISLKEWPSSEAIRQTFTPNGQGFDIVIEAAGQPTTWEQAIELVRKGGLVNLFGGCQSGTSINVDTRRLHYDEITLISLFHHTPFFFQKALDLMSTCEVDPIALVHRVMPMAEFETALQLVEAGEAIKIALKPELDPASQPQTL